MFPSKSLLACLALASVALAATEPLDARAHGELHRMIRKRAGTIGVALPPPSSNNAGAGGAPVLNVGNGLPSSVTSATSAGTPAASDANASSTPAADTASNVVTPTSNASAATPSAKTSDSTSGTSLPASSVQTASTPNASSTPASASQLSASASGSSTPSGSNQSSVPASSGSPSSSGAVAPSSSQKAAAPSANDTPAQQAPAPTPSPPAQGNSPQGTGGRSTVVVNQMTTVVGEAAAQETAAPAPTSGVSATAKVSMAVVGGIIGAVAGVALIWTIIRKWKFKPSDEFEDRMRPIDWQPTDPNDSGLPSNRHSVASSFHSGAHGDNNLAGRGGYGATGAANASLQPVPEHDFTATAPVGGYADLARGPSVGRGPSPPMAQYGQNAYDYGGAPRY